MANNSMFSHNEIDHFGDDGIDYAASNISITHNYIHDNFDIGDGNHEDGMQGQIGPVLGASPTTHFSNILIDSNLVIRQTDPKLAFPTYLQGIDAFDEDWTNLTVTNNVVVDQRLLGHRLCERAWRQDHQQHGCCGRLECHKPGNCSAAP